MVDTIDWSRFGQGPRAPFAQISVPATNKEVSDLDVATQIIQHTMRQWCFSPVSKSMLLMLFVRMYLRREDHDQW